MKKLILIIVLFSQQVIYTQNDLPADQIYDNVNNSVVVVIAYDKKDNMYQGSGVVISSSGYIATNYHVCSDADKIEIKHFTQQIKNPEIVYKDENKDILILKVNENLFKPISIGTSVNLKQGQRIYAIGSPEGYENSISEGIISGFRIENNANLIQMTAPITDGSSGGAVVNSKGELIGLSVSGQHDGNIYFVIPVEDILNLIYPSNNFAVTNETENYLQKGKEANKQKDYESAVLYFSKYLEKNLNDFDAYYSRGYANFKLKKFKPAIVDFTKALEFNKTKFETYFYRANSYYSLKDFTNSLNDYTEAINIAPQYTELYYNRGYANFKLKKYENAAADWNKAIEYNDEYLKELKPKIEEANKRLEIQKNQQ
jgi:tetratricopeptide (TPR) repeat protein